MARADYLFSEFDLRNGLEAEREKMFQEIESIEKNRLLNTSVPDLVDYFVEKYTVNAPKLLEDKISTDQAETQVDVSRDPNRYISDPSRPFYVPGTKITFFVPFEGDGELFKAQSSMMSFNPPRASVHGQEIHATYTTTSHDGAEIRKQFDGLLGQIKQLLTGTNNDVGIYNSEIRQNAEARINARREKLLKDQNMVADLGFPLRKREDAPTTYSAPVVAKKIHPQMPPASTTPFKPEPTLPMEQYEHILSVVSGMVHVMERSPSSFVNMKEEDIRQHFLVQLNGQYEGKATGETFNESGKTDILIREQDKNIFIAECKFWEGPEAFTKAINQLLGYTSWRDTKTAIILFNRNKSFSDVLAQIPDIVKQHPNFKRELEYSSETGYRYALHHNDDKNREIIVTILAFEVPTETK